MKNQSYGVLWDMDGVLVDTREEHYRAWSVTLQAYGIPFSRPAFQSVFGMNDDEAIARLSDRPLPPAMVAEIGDRKELAFRQLMLGRMQLLPGVQAWLERFSQWGFPQAVASSAPRANIDEVLAGVGIRDFFAAIASAEGLPSKPDPAIYLKAARLINMPPERCWVVEDAVWGVAGAKSAGMRCIAVATTHPVEALQGADLVVERLDALTPAVFQSLAFS